MRLRLEADFRERKTQRRLPVHEEISKLRRTKRKEGAARMPPLGHSERCLHEASAGPQVRRNKDQTEGQVMDLIKNWKIHVLALIIVAIAEFIGVQ